MRKTATKTFKGKYEHEIITVSYDKVEEKRFSGVSINHVEITIGNTTMLRTGLSACGKDPFKELKEVIAKFDEWWGKQK